MATDDAGIPTLTGGLSSLTLHVALGLLSPAIAATLFGIWVVLQPSDEVMGGLAMLGLSPYVLAPLVGYGLLLYDGSALPEDEPCLRSGTVLGRLSWFEFASLPGCRLWTADPEEASRVRQRGGLRPEERGFEMVLTQPRGRRADSHAWAAVRTVRDVMLGITTSCLFTGALAFLVAASDLQWLARPLEALAWDVGLVVFLVILIAWMPAIVAFISGFFAVYVAVSVVWNLLHPRIVDRVSLTTHTLKTAAGELDLAERGLGAEVRYTAYGAQIAVWNRRQRLVFHGDHGVLVALVEAIRERAYLQDRSPSQVPEPLARVLQSAKGRAEGPAGSR